MKISYDKTGVEGRIAVTTPYNKYYVEELKSLLSGVKYLGNSDWAFDEEDKPVVEDLVFKYFGDVHWMRVEFDLNREDELSVDGVKLLYISRDYFKWSGTTEYKIIESDIETSGSRKYPDVSGRCVLNILMRKDAVIIPEPAVIEVAVVDEKRPSPLNTFSKEALLTELQSRFETKEDYTEWMNSN